MNREEAQLIVDLCAVAQGPSVQARDVRRPELRQKMEELRARPEPPKGTPEQARLYAGLYERVYQPLNGQTIPESDLIEAQKVLSNNKGRPKEHDERELFGALGYVVVSNSKRAVTQDNVDPWVDKVINEYLDRMSKKGRVIEEHSKHRDWIKRFFQEYLSED